MQALLRGASKAVQGRPLIVIVGPTAAGKSALAMQTATELGTEIISADSVQVYRGLDIGSAKPTPADRRAVVHHALDLWAPEVQANAGAWVSYVTPIIEHLQDQGKTPILVGGTGLWVRALLEGLAEIPPVPAEIRLSVTERLLAQGPESLHRELSMHDPETAARLATNDRQRITRALEVYQASGEPLSAHLARHQAQKAAAMPRYHVSMIGVFPAREVLVKRIALRAAAMIAAGLVEEVEQLLAAGLSPEAAGLQTLGYREVVAALGGHAGAATPMRSSLGQVSLGQVDRQALAERVAAAHRRYAKRQETWWRDTVFDQRHS